MKVSLNAVQEFLDFELPPVAKLVEKIGAQLGAVEEVVNLGEKYRGIIIIKVISCQEHPNANKLTICKIDDGGKAKDVKRDSNGYVQVVCGAPNVRAGMLAAWLPAGATVPATAGRAPFVLGTREIRGQKSNGMLASPKELDISDSHGGILVVDIGKPGDDFAKVYGLDDYIIDIENKMFTHRPDCFGFLGVAREIAGILGRSFESPSWFVPTPVFPKPTGDPLPFAIKNEIPALVPRFSAISLGNVKIGLSPVRLQIELSKVGQKPVNNIVDLTNYYMLLSGQPLHAYDYDKVKALSGGSQPTIVIRNARPNEKLKLLNGREIKPRGEDVMIATDKQLIGFGGVMGGADTEVDADTKNIILESANFDMYSIRRTSMAHGLFTDAATRFTKGQSPLQNLTALIGIVDQILKLGIGEAASRETESNSIDKTTLKRSSLYPPVAVSADFINQRLGLRLSASEMKKLLENVEFGAEAKADMLSVTAPFWRTDIELREDVVEEVGRLYGYDHLPLELPSRDLTPAPRDQLLETKDKIRDELAKSGANETLTYSFVHGDLLEKVGQDKAKAFQVANALSPDLQYYRISLIPSLLEKIHPNIKAGYDQFALFEIGKTHNFAHKSDKAGLPSEFEAVALVVAANNKLKKAGAAYYEARKYLETLVGHDALEFKPIDKKMQDYQVVQPYDPNRAALVSLKAGGLLGIIGEFKPSVASKLKLPKYCAGFEIDTKVLDPVLAAGPSYQPLSRFPAVKQDITLKVASDLSYIELYDFVNKELAASAPRDTRIQLDPVDIYQRANTKKYKQITLRVTITPQNRTLTDKEANTVLDAAAKAAKAKLGAERI